MCPKCFRKVTDKTLVELYGLWSSIGEAVHNYNYCIYYNLARIWSVFPLVFNYVPELCFRRTQSSYDG